MKQYPPECIKNISSKFSRILNVWSVILLSTKNNINTFMITYRRIHYYYNYDRYDFIHLTGETVSSAREVLFLFF